MFRLCERLASTPSLISVSAPVTICGDIHGQFYDLMRLIEKAGDPKDTKYVFLGGLVFNNFQCFIIHFRLCGSRILQSRNVDLFISYSRLLSRKHHFAARQPRDATCFTSIRVLWRVPKQIWSQCRLVCLLQSNNRNFDSCLKFDIQVFDLLPIAALVNDSVFCVHGELKLTR